MLRPFLLVGVGGSGGKTLRAVRYTLDLRLRAAGWTEGIPDAWQFLHIDTPVAQDDPSFPAPYLPAESYFGLVADGAQYTNVISKIDSGLPAKSKEDAHRQFPDPAKVPVNIRTGAGQYRAVGRTVAMAKLSGIAAAADAAFGRLRRPDALSQLARLTDELGGDVKSGMISEPVFLVVSSVAGGSGAGQYLDVVDAIKARFNGAAWAMDAFGILYAPDVFDGIKGTDGVPRNSLAAISETVNGYWNNQPSESTRNLFQAAGLQISSGGALDRSGVRYPFIVGRQGPNTVFDGQTDIYLAISTTIAAWMTDDRFQADIASYSQGNWDSGALPVPDNTPFRKGDARTPVASAIGFGRVTLAREKFIQYSTERFARACIDWMLKAHAENDPRFQIMDEDAHVLDIASKFEMTFLHASGLYELNDDRGENNQVIDALRPGDELKTAMFQTRQDIAQRASQGLDKNGGLDLDSWHSRLLSLRDELVGEVRDLDMRLRQKKLDEWSENIQKNLTHTVSRFVADQGLRVTENLIDRLSDSVGQAIGQLRGESAQFADSVGHLSGYVHDDLKTAGDPNSLRPDSDPVQTALDTVQESLRWECEAALRYMAANVLQEFDKEVIVPLKRFIGSSRDALEQSVNAPKLPDGRNNDYLFWPERNSPVVPRKYEPSSNEKMLLETNEFSDTFEKLVTQTVGGDRFMDAINQVMTELLVGMEGRELVSVKQFWSPTTSADPRTMGTVAKKPFFYMSDNVEDYLDVALSWMERRGTAFSSFITEDLKSYLNESQDPAEYKRREDRFVGHIQAAYSAAAPLVLADANLLQAVHELAPGQDGQPIISTIPFDKSHRVYQRLFSFFVGEFSKTPATGDNKIDPTEAVKKLFRDQNVDSIEFFAVQGKPVQPMVLTSVVGPIASAWKKQNTKPDKRRNFWRWSRARLLAESIPMDREAYEAMLRGWYVAMFADMIRDEEDRDLGPKISIKRADGGYTDFPYPLLHPGTPQKHDYVAAVIESSIIAMVLCGARGDLGPLEAYSRLRELGEDENRLNHEVAEIIRHGRKKEDGSDPVSVEERKQRVLKWLDNRLSEFDTDMGRLTAGKRVYDYPLIWEIRHDVQTALRTLQTQVGEVLPDSLSEEPAPL